jgi:hypothetical protein
MIDHKFTIAQYERIMDMGIVCDRIELIAGVLWCKETGRPYRFHRSDFEAMAKAGLIDPAAVKLVDGELIDKEPLP